MILVDAKTKTTDNSPLNLSAQKDEKPTLSFSQLLKGISKDQADDSKTIQNGALVLALDEGEEITLKTAVDDKDKKDFSSLLMNDKDVPKEVKSKNNTPKTAVLAENLEINPHLSTKMDQKEIKLLIADAKKYLKDKILQSDDYKMAQTKELPKTLKGLVQVAKKFGIDLSKISIEEVKTQKTSTASESDLSEIIDTKQQKIKTKTEQKAEQKIEIKSAHKTEIKSEVKLESAKEIVEKPKTESKPQIKAEVTSKTATQSKKDDAVAESKVKTEVKPQLKPEVKTTPLFVQSQKVVTTEQTLKARELKILEPSAKKTPKDRADETLKLLLKGEKISKSDSNIKLTSDFSVATARVIAPSAATEAQKSLESLLRGDSTEHSASKSDSIVLPKADSFELKLNEAKQMTKYLSQDVKQAIDNYKAPFSRIKVQLNPQKLGEIDMTVVQRGKNLHVNISSNNAAINALAMNVNDLKVQLTNNGIQNATLNFNSGSSDGGQAGHQDQNHRQNQQASQEYSYFDKDEQNEEIINSLEIVVPNYV